MVHKFYSLLNFYVWEQCYAELYEKVKIRDKKNESEKEKMDRYKSRIQSEKKINRYLLSELDPEKVTLNPARIKLTHDYNEFKKQEFEIENPGGSIIKISPETAVYQWLFTNSYRPATNSQPYLLVDIKSLASVSKLKKM